MSIDTMIPFPLAYLDWVKEIKGAKSIEETERHDWAMEFGRIYSEAGGQVNGVDIMIVKGGK